MKGSKVFFLSIAISLASFASAQIPAGPSFPGTVSTGSCSFSYGSVLGYTPVGNVLTSNNIYATALHCACCDAQTNCLRATNFGFALPSGAVITGITVQIEKRGSFGSNVQDNGLRLLKGGVEVGSNYAQFGIPWGTLDSYYTYGGCLNLWGTTWTPADINSPNFGLVFASIDYACSVNNTSFIDHVMVTVCYNLVLPVELLEFNADKKEETVLLHWKTQSESQSDYFVVQRSLDGIEFSSVDSIPAAGNSSILKNYSLYDKNPLTGLSYYRLKQVDINGTFAYSNLKAVDFSEITLEVFPNPVFDFVTVSIKSGSSYQSSFSLFNTLGEMVFQKDIGFTNAESQQVNISAIPDGSYLMVLSDKDGRIALRQQLIKISQ
jgi:hypothetical protein